MEEIKLGDLVRSKLNPDSGIMKFIYDFEDGTIGLVFMDGNSRGSRAVFPKDMWFKDCDTLNEGLRPKVIQP